MGMIAKRKEEDGDRLVLHPDCGYKNMKWAT